MSTSRWKRALKPHTDMPHPVEKVDTADIRRWLEQKAAEAEYTSLLAFAADGVLWGHVGKDVEGKASLVTPAQAVLLRSETLTEARLFGEKGELHIWRVTDGVWCARRIERGDAEAGVAFDESHILWGTHGKDAGGGFRTMTDGANGMCHFVPVPGAVGDWGERRPLRLHVRNYVAEDDTGILRVVDARLLQLEVVETC